MSFPFFIQHDQMDCGPTCLRIIAKYYGKSMSLETLKKITELGRDGTSFKNLSASAEKIGFRTLGVRITYEQLRNEVLLPCIAHWNAIHFVVVYKVTKTHVHIADPAYGLIKYSKQDFISSWIGRTAEPGQDAGGAILLLEPTPEFNDSDADDDREGKGFGFLLQYVTRYKNFIGQLVLGLFLGSILQLLVPFITQSIVDIGIQNNDLNFVYLMLAAQLSLFFGRISVDVIRSWILLHVSTRINIALVSDFFIKMMRLPISYFDVRMTGDLLQRISDHKRIEKLLTSSSLSVLFSTMNLVLFGGILLAYNFVIFLVFFAGSVAYFSWIFLFLKKRREIDFRKFSKMGSEQSKVIELINGMQEIKLNNAERQKRWEWELLQSQLFKIELKGHTLEQIQASGANILNELKNIIITFVAAQLVLNGDITLGVMLSISYIIGQLNAPLLQIIEFTINSQDAKIALERLSDIHNKSNEDDINDNKYHSLNGRQDIVINDLQYRYPGTESVVVDGLDVTIPANKVTAIVGASGSGKTTLLKLLLQFYKPLKGEIRVGGLNLNNVSPASWRAACGIVMQEGFIFNDTVIKNICVDGNVDMDRLMSALEIANIDRFVENLPNGLNTKIGQEGLGISTGQKQRILIARAVYKDPQFIFFDEATSSLDTTNERVIMDNLEAFFEGRTAIVIAHRLSTVKKADKIIVLRDGKIAEEGTHDELLINRGPYYNLVIDQLQLEKSVI